MNPFSSEPFFENLVEMNWIRNSLVMVIKCAPLSTLIVSNHPIKNYKNDYEENVLELQEMIEVLKRKS